MTSGGANLPPEVCVFVLLVLLLGALVCGSSTLAGWRLCRGLARAQAVQMLDGTDVVRVTSDPGAWPWSGARVLFIPPDTPDLELE